MSQPTTRQLLCALVAAPFRGLLLVVALPFFGWVAIAAAIAAKLRRPLPVVSPAPDHKG